MAKRFYKILDDHGIKGWCSKIRVLNDYQQTQRLF